MSGRRFEFVLWARRCGGGRWGSCGQADSFEIGANGDRLSQRRDNFHAPAATGALSDIDGEHPRQQLCPGEAMWAGMVSRCRSRLGIVLGPCHDFVSVACAGRQHTVVSRPQFRARSMAVRQRIRLRELFLSTGQFRLRLYHRRLLRSAEHAPVQVGF